jgi:uncharacterized sulfatase
LQAAGLASGVTRAAARRTNVLFISVDDLNRSLHCFGNTQVRTPNIDKLAARGVCFTSAFSNYASCLPSRISFLSGWYPERTGVVTFGPRPRDRQLKDVTYLPQHFRNNSYVTARLDKVFHIGADDARSWDISEEPIKDEQGKGVVVFTPREIEAQRLAAHVLVEGKFEKCRGEKGNYAVVDVDDSRLVDGLNVQRAAELMEQFSKGSQPFFLAVGLRRPHLPRILPKKYFDMYPPQKIELPPTPPNYDPAAWVSREDQQRIIAHYYAAVTYMDARVGQLLDTLDRLRQRDNTIVVLFGDQGYALGERDNHYGKGTLGERSFAVPLIVSAPSAKQNGRSCGKVVELLDMYPTLVDLCGLPQPASGLQGRSLAPLLANASAAWEERVIGAWGLKDYVRPGLSVRTARYRYSEREDGTPLEMFDYQTDPYEWRNLIADPALEGVRRQLAAVLRRPRA